MMRVSRQRRRRGLAQYQPLAYRSMYMPGVVQIPGSTILRPYPSPLIPRPPVATAPLGEQPSLVPGPVTAAAPVAAGPTPAPAGPTVTAAADSVSYAAEQGVSIAPFGPTATATTSPGGLTDFLTAQTLVAGVSNWMIVAAAAAAVYFLGKKR